MGITRLAIPAGITPPKVVNVPDQWSSAWFRSFIKIWLQNQANRLTSGQAAVVLGSDGSLTVNTSEGTSGYVLTSQGAGQPAIWAPGGGGGGLTSVGLADTSTTPIYAISNSPLTSNGTLDFALVTQTKNTVFAGPTTGGATQPAFRALVVSDLPTGYLYSNLSGAPSIPTGANPTADVGLSAVNGSATTFMRSDGAPALDQTIAPTWSGAHAFTPSTGVTAATINAAANNHGLVINGGNNTGGNSYAAQINGGTGTTGNQSGLAIVAGTNGADVALLVQSTGGSNFLTIAGDGGLTCHSPTGGDQGAGTINVSGGYYVNGVAIGSGSGTGAKVQTFTQSGGASQTYTVPPGAKVVRVYCIGGGGGGGSGASQASGSACSGGAGGGAGGISVADFDPSILGSSVTVTFTNASTGGNGGAAMSTTSHAGNTGVAGSAAEFGGFLIAYGGGGGGGGGLAAAATGGTAGQGSVGAGTIGSNSNNGAGGTNGTGQTWAAFNSSSMAPTGGGSAGGISTTPAAAAGGAGGWNASGPFVNSVAGTAGTVNNNGGNGSASGGFGSPAGGGGGGGSSITGNGGTGGNGGNYGAGGGGGGSCLNGHSSGAGGNGGPAAVICIAW